MLSPSLYFHTLRHLRPGQVLARLRYRLGAPSLPSDAFPGVARREGRWIAPPPDKAPSLFGPRQVRFLNRERRLTFPADWQCAADRLWLYNLHYFDDLVARDSAARARWHEELIATWVRDNPPASGVGWEPYPISLRAVNWIKWCQAGNRLDAASLASLATQLRYLRRRIEWHLLGNHVLANAKALVFGGLLFAGQEPDEWLEFGARLLEEQLAEQILPDGGHFERSPMYHALALEDVLDLVNALQAWSQRIFAQRRQLTETLTASAAKMLTWLETMTHPDGQIAFFNDAANGIARPLSALKAYASALGVAQKPSSSDLESSGYARLEEGPWCVLFDAAPIGPDYQPGHAHADTLSFELCVGHERIISNSGTSTYEKGEQRAFERSTRAHNTVEIDGQNSSEVWASFRVARRARPFDRSVSMDKERVLAACAHDGYQRLPGRPVHRRTLEVTAHAVRWTDRVDGAASHKIRGFIPLHPGVWASVAHARASLLTPGGRRLVLSGTGIESLLVQDGTYAREFGLCEPRVVLAWEFAGRLPMEATFTLAVEH